MLGMLVCKNLVVNGRRTSMRLEPDIWEALQDIAGREGLKLKELVSRIEAQPVEASGAGPNLSSTVRVFVANYYRAAATEDGHRLAGHGCGEPLVGTVFEIAQERAGKGGGSPRRSANGENRLSA